MCRWSLNRFTLEQHGHALCAIEHRSRRICTRHLLATAPPLPAPPAHLRPYAKHRTEQVDVRREPELIIRGVTLSEGGGGY